MQAKDRFLSIPKVAELCDVSVTTVRRWITANEFTTHRFGRQIRVDHHDLERFIERCRD